MPANAADILAVLEQKALDYEHMSIQRARDCQQLLKEILNSSGFRSELAHDNQKKKAGEWVLSNYPRWAYEIAYRLDDPGYQFEKKAKVGLANLCRELVEEFDSSDCFYATALATRGDSPFFLKQAARSLLID